MSLRRKPVGVHRRAATWPRSLRLRAGTAALVIATLAIGSAITTHTPDVDAQQQPFVRTGNVGAATDARTFSTTVLGVRGAAAITQNGLTHDTTGIWIIVKLRLTAHTDPIIIGYAALRDGQGRTYRATGRINQPLAAGRLLEPGIAVTGELAFEVPVSVATDLSIQLAVPPLDQRMDAIAQIQLPVDANQVQQWRKLSKPVTVETPEVAQ